jgi:hypothetical protein
MSATREGSKALLAAGIVLRIVVFIFLAAGNNDDHTAVVKYLAGHGRLPTLWDTLQAQHPPLYYLLAAPLWKWTEHPKGVQLLSLVFSIATLVAIYHLVYRTPLIESARARLYGFMTACFLPQLVMFSLYLSNDTLAILLGNLAILQAWRYIQQPDRRRLMVLGALTAAGLLTKLTFLAYLPVFAILVFWVKDRTRRAAVEALVFLGITFALGSYKLVDNFVRFGDPMITGLDPRFHYPNLQAHAVTYRGLASYVDVNVLKLVPEPVLSPSTWGSYPVILYATFWYQYIPESNFIGNRTRPSMYLGSLIYILGLLPSVVFLIGWIASLRPGVTKGVANGAANGAALARWIGALLILFTGLMFLPAMLKYHVWSVVQARYLFPAMFACLMMFAEGMRIVGRWAVVRRALAVCMWGLTALFVIYFASECWHWV